MNKDIFENQLFAITTIIITEFTSDRGKEQCTASGFYYTMISPEDQKDKSERWIKVEGFQLVTNRHVIYPKVDGKVYLIEKMTFGIREIVNDEIKWIPITLSRNEIIARTKLHNNPCVDVVVIDVSDIIHKIINDYKDRNLMIPTALTGSNLPENQPLTIDVTTDIIVASYPKGFYDEVNKFPIVKSGIIASAWNYNFNGNPLFEIDAQLFPGSSGGLVISKPQNIAMIDGQLKQSMSKQFVFLGVYSGEYTWEENVQHKDGSVEKIKRSYGLGNVWYSYLIPEIIENGESIKQKEQINT